MRATTPILLALTLALPAPGVAQIVEGRVVQYDTEEPLRGADVFLLGEDDQKVALTFSDSTGLFRLAAPAVGTWRVGAELIGYGAVRSEPLNIGEEATVQVEIRMAIDPVEIEDPVVVVAARGGSPELAAFWKRVERGERTGFGNFVYGEELERSTLYASDAVRLIPGVRVVPRGLGQGQLIVMRGGCIPSIYVDGMQLNRMRRGESLDLYVSLSDIEGIEVYRGAEQPGGVYYDQTGCGLVLVWTKRGDPNGPAFSWTRLAVGAALFLGILLLR